MYKQGWLTEQFEENRPRLRGVAYRMLGSLSEAEDAVQEAWLRLHRIDPATVENLGGWLTTVVSRVCLDMLRSRKSRREDPIDTQVTEPSVVRGEGVDPEGEAVLADSVGVALLVVLDALTPADAWRSSCMICSACRSARSLPSWDGRRLRPSSSRAARAGGCAARLRHRTSFGLDSTKLSRHF
jgi:RNA polymerase sigma factor (sigma-70 family)